VNFYGFTLFIANALDGFSTGEVQSVDGIVNLKKLIH